MPSLADPLDPTQVICADCHYVTQEQQEALFSTAIDIGIGYNAQGWAS